MTEPGGSPAKRGVEIWRGPREDLARRAAERIAAALAERLRAAPTAVLGLVGGRSVGGIYRELRGGALAWERVHIFLADERLVPPGSAESNERLIRDELTQPLVAAGRLPPDNFHPFPLGTEAPERAAAHYGAELARLGGRFDAGLLSAGEDGHVASLFPGRTWTDGRGGSFVIVADAPKPPPRRVSASADLLERTSLGLVAFFGAGKRDALARFLDPSVPRALCPAKLACAMGEAVALVDEAGPEA